jgi:hypothetical protein
MRKYHFQAVSAPVRGQLNKADIEGWVVAKNIDQADGILQARGWKRDSLTPYPNTFQFPTEWLSSKLTWVNVVR